MRRHISMEQLARDVLAEASVAQEKTASAAPKVALSTELGALLTKVASEIRHMDTDALTYADIARVAEARRGKR